MTDEKMLEALENLRIQARRALLAAVDDGQLAAACDIAALAATLQEILAAADKVDGDAPADALRDVIKSEVRIAITMRGWGV